MRPFLTSQFKFTSISSATLMRAFSIVAIVANHFDWFSVIGGAMFLLVLSGYNFVCYTLPKCGFNTLTKAHEAPVPYQPKQTASQIFRFLWKILLPAWVYPLCLSLLTGQTPVYTWLFISNWMGPDYAGGLSYWFLDIWVQTFLIVILLVSIPSCWRWLNRQPFGFFLGLFVFSYGLSCWCLYTWDTRAWLDRLPHLLFYLFALGGLISVSHTRRQKWVVGFLIAAVAGHYLSSPVGQDIRLMLLGAFLIIALPKMYIPNGIAVVINYLARYSLFIYLSHFQAKMVIVGVLGIHSPWLISVLALSLGVIYGMIWKKMVEPRLNLAYLKQLIYSKRF